MSLIGGQYGFLSLSRSSGSHCSSANFRLLYQLRKLAHILQSNMSRNLKALLNVCFAGIQIENRSQNNHNYKNTIHISQMKEIYSLQDQQKPKDQKECKNTAFYTVWHQNQHQYDSTRAKNHNINKITKNKKYQINSISYKITNFQFNQEIKQKICPVKSQYKNLNQKIFDFIQTKEEYQQLKHFKSCLKNKFQLEKNQIKKGLRQLKKQEKIKKKQNMKQKNSLLETIEAKRQIINIKSQQIRQKNRNIKIFKEFLQNNQNETSLNTQKIPFPFVTVKIFQKVQQKPYIFYEDTDRQIIHLKGLKNYILEGESAFIMKAYQKFSNQLNCIKNI